MTSGPFGGASRFWPVQFDLDTIYREHHGFIRWVVRAWGVPESAVDDTVQEVFVSAFRRRGTAPTSGLQHWLLGVARSTTFVTRRSQARRLDRDTEWYLSHPAALTAPEDAVEHRRDLERIGQVLEGLPEEQREAFLLIDVGGMTARAVAERDGTSANTVSSRLRLARRALRDACVSVPESPARKPARHHVLWFAFLRRSAAVPLVSVGAGVATVVVAASVLGQPTWRPPAESTALVAPERSALRARSRPALELGATAATVPSQREATAAVVPSPQDAPAPLERDDDATLTRDRGRAPAGARPSGRTAEDESRREYLRRDQPSTLQHETALLQRLAQAMDRGDSEGARALSREYTATFPRGELQAYHDRLRRHLDRP